MAKEIVSTLLCRLCCCDDARLMDLLLNNPHANTHLMQNRPDELQRQRRELVLFEEIVQILLQHLEHQARVVLVLEALERAHEIEFVRILLAEP